MTDTIVTSKRKPCTGVRKQFKGDLRQTILTSIAAAGASCPAVTAEWAKACIREGASPSIMAYLAANAKHDPALIKRLRDNPSLAKSLNPRAADAAQQTHASKEGRDHVE